MLRRGRVNLPDHLHLPAAGLNTVVGKGLVKLGHVGQVLLRILDVLEALGVLRLKVFLENALKSLLVLTPLSTVNIGLSLSLANLVGRLARAGLLLGFLLVTIALSLATPGRSTSSRRGRRRSGLGGRAVVVVHTPHVVPQVPLAGEAMSGKRAFASLISAEVGLLSMSVHSVGLALMTKKASSGRETGVLASFNLAAVGLEVRIDELAVMVDDG